VAHDLAPDRDLGPKQSCGGSQPVWSMNKQCA
jgi:hypothetical protein